MGSISHNVMRCVPAKSDFRPLGLLVGTVAKVAIAFTMIGVLIVAALFDLVQRRLRRTRDQKPRH